MPHLKYVAAGLVAIGALSFTSTASADTGPMPVTADHAERQVMDCFVGNINNGDSWTAEAEMSVHPGSATWYEHGDRLKTVDSLSDGNRTLGRIRWCSDGEWSAWRTYDSGPNEGNIDVEWDDFELTEGRKVQIMACRDNGANGDRCGRTINANA